MVMTKGAILLLLFLAVCLASAQSPMIDSLHQIVSLQRHDSTELQALLNLANEFSRKDIQQAKLYAHQTVSLAQRIKNNLSLCNGYLYLVTLNQSSGRLDSATYYLDQMKKVQEANPQNSKIRINYNQTAGLFYKNQGLYKKALPFMIDNLTLLKDENIGRAGQFLNLGNVYYNLGDYKNAATNHLEGLTLFEKLNNKRGQSFCYQSLGNDFLSLNQFEQAKEYFQHSYTLKHELQDKRGMITSLTSLGDSSTELGEFGVAENYYKQAWQIAQEMKIIFEESRAQFQLGLLYKRMSDLSKAYSTISSAIQLAKQTGDSTLVAKMIGELVTLDFQKNSSDIENTLTKNINTLISSGDRDAVATEYARLSQYHESKGQFEKALYYLKKYENLKDSLEGNAVLLQIKQIEEQYENEKNEIEIGLLKKEQELQTLALSRQKTIISAVMVALISVTIISLLLINRNKVLSETRRLIEIERVRNNISRDLHDDIGSTLSSINILSQVALVEQNGNTSNYLQRIKDQSNQMMEDMSDMVWSINPRNDSMDKIITRMREFAIEIFDSSGIDFRFTENVGATTSLDSDKRKNLFLIFKEIINNAAKYSKASSIEIELSQEGRNLTLSVKDNGQGFDEATTTSGNGLRNIRERANEINAKITLKSNKEEGTEWELTLSVA